MKQSIFLFLFSGALLSANAQGFEYKGYSGSMFMHAGGMSSKDFDVTNSSGKTQTYQIDSWERGIGGKIAFMFNDGIRFGVEGYSSKTVYGDFHSTFSVGWGGLLVDYLYVDRIVSYFAGVTLGGGQVTNTLLTERESRNPETSEIMRNRYPVGILNPFLGLEVRVTPRLLIALKADYMLRFTNTKYDDWGKGVRIYLGTTFRLKDDDN